MATALALLWRFKWPLLAALIVTGAYWKGRADANENCRAEEYKAVIAQMQRDVHAERQAEAFETERQKEDEALALAREAELQGYVEELRADKTCRRTLGDGDVKRLRKIDGGQRP
jgi:predicted DNA-binding WGR domain protein